MIRRAVHESNVSGVWKIAVSHFECLLPTCVHDHIVRLKVVDLRADGKKEYVEQYTHIFSELAIGSAYTHT